MQIKLGLIAAGLAASATASRSYYGSSTNQQVGKVFSTEYVQPNIEEVCFSVRPIASCDDQNVATGVKYQKVGFHCLNRNSPIVKQFRHEADQGQQLPLEHKSQDIQAYVEVPMRCTPINSEEKRLRKESEKTSEQKIHIVQNQDGEEESFLFEHKPWTGEQSPEEQQQRRSIRRSQNQKKLQSRNGLNVQDSDDEDWIDEQELDTMEQYSDFINKQTTMHHILRMNNEKFDLLMEHLKFIAHQNRRSDKWSQQLDMILPNVFSKVAKQFFENVLEKQTTSQQEKEELYEQYKDVVKRIYAYTVKQALQMRQLNQITGKFNGENQQNEQQFTNKVAKNLWYKIQKELTNKQIENVRQVAENVEHQKTQLDRMWAEETLAAWNNEQLKQLEKDLTKTLVAGLQMVNHKVASSQNGMQTEEYRKYHGQDYEESLRSQYPNLFQKLNSISKLNQWKN